MPIEKINVSLCTGCGKCVNSCPMDVIRFDEEAGKAVIRCPGDCIACFSCEGDCPVKPIYVSPNRGTRPPPAW